MSGRHLFLFLFYVHILSKCQASVITVPPPPSVTVPIYTTATLICEGNGNELNWLVPPDIQQQSDVSFTDPGIGPGNLSSVLTITGLPINNGISIGCQISSYPPLNQVVSYCILIVTGVSPVEDLQYNFTTNNSLLIRWSPPVYYSNDVPFDSSASYQVLVTDEEDGDIILDTNTPNRNITVPNVTECDTFNIRVTALVAQYTSNNNTERNNGSFGYYVNITSNFTNDLASNVSIELSCPPTKCNTSLTITNSSQVIDQYTINGSDKVVNDARTLSPCEEYHYTVRVFNIRNKLENEISTIISTYQVTDLYISDTYTDGSVGVQCIFAESSTADGCHVIFTDTSNGRNESFNITGSDNTIISVSTSGNYTVTVHGIINGYITPWTCVQPKQVNVTIAPTPSPISGATNSVNSIYSTTNDILTISKSPSPSGGIDGTIGSSSPGSGKVGDSMLYVISGVIGALLIVVIVIVAALLLIRKRQAKKKMAILNSEIAVCHQPQAEMSHYQEISIGPVTIDMSTDDVIPEVPISEPVQGNREDPYRVSTDELLAIRKSQQNNSHVTTTPQEGQTQNGSSSSSSHGSCGLPPNIATPSHNHDTVTVTGGITAVYSLVGRRTDTNETELVVNPPPAEYTGDISKGQPTCSSSSTYNSTAPLLKPGHDDCSDDETTATAYAVTPATVAPTYAVIAKRTDDTDTPAVPPAVPPSMYDKVTGHINKRGVVTTYPPPPPKATQPTIDNDIHDESTLTCDDNTEAPPPSYDDLTVPTECSHPQEEVSDSASGLSTSVYPPPNGPTANYPIIHNNIHLNFGPEVSYVPTLSSTSDNDSCPTVAMGPIQLPNKVPVDVEADDRCLVSIVGTLSTPPSPRSSSFSDTTTHTTDTSTTKDHVFAELPIHVSKGGAFNGIQQRRHDDYNHQRSILVITCHAWKYRPDDSSSVEDENIEISPISIGNEKKKIDKEREGDSNIEVFAAGLKVNAEGLLEEHEKETERVSDMNFKHRKKSNNGQKNAGVTMNGELVKTKPNKILCQNEAVIDRPLDAKKVFKRDKGSTRSATGFSSQRQANYSLLSKLYKAVQHLLYIKLSLLCILCCISSSDVIDALVFDRPTINSTVVSASVWSESLNYKHRVRKKEKEKPSIERSHGNLLNVKYMLSLLFVSLVLFSVGIYSALNSLRVPLIMIYNGLFNILCSFNLYNPFAIYGTIILLLILSNFASTYYFDLIQKLSSTTTTSYLEPVDEIPHEPDPP